MIGDSIHQSFEHLHRLVMKKAKEAKDTVYISFRLDDEEAEMFNNYKRLQFLKNNAEAARKLMFERLHEILPTNKHQARNAEAN